MFRQTGHKTKGQHINTYSRVIHNPAFLNETGPFLHLPARKTGATFPFHQPNLSLRDETVARSDLPRPVRHQRIHAGTNSATPPALHLSFALAVRLAAGRQASSGVHQLPQTACSPVSPVRMRTAFSMEVTKTFPSPILPVRAALIIPSTAGVTWLSAKTTSILILGKKSTVYSLPR